MTVITIHMRKNDGLENYSKKIFFFFFFLVFSHAGGSVSLPGVRESGCISRRLPDDPGGFTCMHVYSLMARGRQTLGVKILMSTESSYHFDHLLQV